jgi:hypothetical protein
MGLRGMKWRIESERLGSTRSDSERFGAIRKLWPPSAMDSVAGLGAGDPAVAPRRLGEGGGGRE